MAKSVARQSNFCKRNVLVKSFKKGCFDIFGKEVVGQPDLVNIFVILEGIDNVNQASII